MPRILNTAAKCLLLVIVSGVFAYAQVSVQCPSLPCTITVTQTQQSASVAPLSLTFTSALNTDSAIQTVNLTNPTSTALAITSSFSGPFTYGGIGTCNSTVPASGSCTISAKYHPTVATAITGTLNISIAGKATQVALNGSVPVAHGVFLKWNASTSVVTGYNLYRSNVSGGPYGLNTSVPVVGTSYLDPSVVFGAGNIYYYVARAINSLGESANSNEAKVIVP